MRWFKIMNGDELAGAEAHEEPVFVCRLPNGAIDICNEAHAQGIVAQDQSCYYQLDGAGSIGVEGALTAVEIAGTEYDDLQREIPDPEDTEPDVPDDPDADKPMTRAELTEKVNQLEEQLEAAKILLGVSE